MRRRLALLTITGVLLIVSACSPASPPRTIAGTGSSSGVSVAPPTSLSPTSTAISPDAVSAVDAMFATLTSESVFSGSVLISQHGQVLLSKGYGLADRDQKIPNSTQTRFLIGSNTKQFTASAILLLEGQGNLKVTDDICAYIPECPSAWSAITIKELLTHTSGITDYTALPDFASYSSKPSTPLQIIAHFRDQPLDFAPGAKWRYSNSGYILLGYIIEQVSGLSYEAFLQQNIFAPLGLRDTGYSHSFGGLAVGYTDGYTTSPVDFWDPSIAYAAGGLYSTVADMYRWEQALTTDALLPAASRSQMFAPQVATPEGAPLGTAYGYGFVIGTDSGRPIVWHDGAVPGFVSLEARYPTDDVTVIVLTNQASVLATLMTILESVSTRIFNLE